MRLSARHWVAVFALLVLVFSAVPMVWKKVERFDTGPGYRISYALSRDYWLYERGLGRLSPTNIPLLGDSVIWGEYVLPEGTLSHYLNEQSGQEDRFRNAGVNGMFPLALEGLHRFYGKPLHGRKIILHCNFLWMTSPKADLHTDKEERFNHADLVPQFSPKIPCYKADLNRRLAAVVERHFPFSQWSSHLQIAYFGQKNLLAWTLEDDGGTPPRFPNAYRNPFSRITLRIPGQPADDAERGPRSPRHKPWSTTGQGTTRFDWVDITHSLQWGAFQRLIELLRSRGDDVLVLVGPFNEHIMAEENRLAFRALRDAVVKQLTGDGVVCVVPEALPSELYADASHPLTEGYRLLAQQIRRDAAFNKWLADR